MRYGARYRPVKVPVEICSGYCGRAIHAGSAMEINRMSRVKQAFKPVDTGRQLAPQLKLVEVCNRNVAKDETVPFRSTFGRYKPTSDFVLGLQIENCRDLQRAKLLEFFVNPRIRAENEVRQNSTAIHEVVR
jgi:hypothetical protein